MLRQLALPEPERCLLSLSLTRTAFHMMSILRGTVFLIESFVILHDI